MLNEEKGCRALRAARRQSLLFYAKDPRAACLPRGDLSAKRIFMDFRQRLSRRRLLGLSGMDMTIAMPMASATAIFSVSAPLAAH